MDRLTLRNLRSAAKKLGATVDSTDSGIHERRHNIDAPVGMVWKANQLHTIACDTFPTQPAWSSEAIAEAIERMAHGLERCTDPNCDHCHIND